MTMFYNSTHRIFISHSSEDDAFGSQLLRDLQAFLEEEDAVWYDTSGLNGGDTWWHKIVQEITVRDTFVVLLSPSAAQSKWVQDEINLAWKLKNTAEGKRIIPVLYQQCEIRNDLDTLQIISFLSPKKYELAFSELLIALGLQIVIDAQRITVVPLDLGSVILEQMENAFTMCDWAAVIRKAEYLVDCLPTLVTAEVYRMQGIAHLKQGEIQSALDALDAMMVLTNDSQYCLRLLSEYASMLGGYDEWEGVLYCTTEALKIAPSDTNWRSGHQYAQQKMQELTEQAQGADEETEVSSTQSQTKGDGDESSVNSTNSFKSTSDFDGFSSINDLFESLFSSTAGGAQRRNEAQRGTDLRYKLMITFEEAVFGCQKEVELLRWEACSICQGKRTQRGTASSRCASCQGTGEIRRVQQSIFGQFINVTQCTKCNGKGSIPVISCEACKGQGRVRNKRRVVVNIPAGVDDGINVRVTGEGEVSEHGNQPGNLYIILTVQSHPIFKREGTTIIYELPISFTQAVLGDKVAVPTLEGTCKRVKLPPGTKQGSAFLLKGLGVPVVYKSERGDQLIVVKEIIVPTHITAEQEYLIRELARLENEQDEQNKDHLFHTFFEKVKGVFQQ